VPYGQGTEHSLAETVEAYASPLAELVEAWTRLSVKAGLKAGIPCQTAKHLHGILGQQDQALPFLLKSDA